ncbi:cell division protein FtsL [Nitrosovibrio tenuis]|uniref:Cell division protein FtsL n=1 Tax=Nitrosovibrio tenuis TaxID=1233 RepID=A0A1H7G3E5_9PROT|nr:cell division protein FtsL [Nitrosovibrio tenuis]SEK31312.1 cell division protein FtsL [Nitrosovibrio tenuis]
MIRINILLTLLLIACALSIVSSQHKARRLFVELEKEQGLARQLAVEWGQLQLEQSTWAMPTRIEKIAVNQFHMRVPDASRIQTIPLANSSAAVSVEVQKP